MRNATLVLTSVLLSTGANAAEPDSYPTDIDLDDQTHRQVVVDREAGLLNGKQVAGQSVCCWTTHVRQAITPTR